MMTLALVQQHLAGSKVVVVVEQVLVVVFVPSKVEVAELLQGVALVVVLPQGLEWME